MKVTTSIQVAVALVALLSGCGAFLPNQHADVLSSRRVAMNGQRSRLFGATRNPILPPPISMRATNVDNYNKVHPKPPLSTGNLFTRKMATASTSALLMAAILITPWELNFDVDFGWQGRPEQEQYHLLNVDIVRSRASAMSEEQLLVNAVWKEVSQQFVDKTYNGLGEEGWKQKRLDAVASVSNAGPDDKEKVYEVIRKMLKFLGDPYTRFLTPDQYDSLTAYARGSTSSTAGIGVQLMLDPASGKVVVINTVKDGPAQKAGVIPGDIVEGIDGEEVDGITAEVVAAKCRGEVGTGVNVALRHGGDGSPSKTVTQLSLTRAQVKVNPVQASMFSTEKGGKKIGLLKIASFSTETKAQVIEGMKEVYGASAIVLDLRGNAGGYMPAGVDVANLFLPPQTRVISEVDKSGRTTVYVSDGIGSDPNVPLYLLVDQRTASASEILTAALQDNHRATVVGTRTFGKGRIQNVQVLGDGSGIAVTKAKYMTPDGRDIHGIGITPDKEVNTCGPDVAATTCLTGIF